jgi:HD-GYP domain-containing protein (c-di-GMP phosphodiesterase class II)
VSEVVRHAPTRLAEVLAVISLASDLGHDQPLEKSLRNAVIAGRLGAQLGLPRDQLSAVYYVSLLRSMGCTGNSHTTALLIGGEDLAFLGLVQTHAGGDLRDWARRAAQHVAATAPALAAQRSERWFLTDGLAAGREAGRSACEVSTALARRLGLSPAVQQGLDQVYERWDGLGPSAVGGEALCLPARVVHVVDVVEIAHRAGGVEAARELVRRRTGSHFDPAVAEPFCLAADDLLGDLDRVDALEAALDAEPTPWPRCQRSELSELARAIADFADLKSPWTLGHSPAVAELAAAAGHAGEREDLLLAGLLHDLGRVAVPNGVWDRPGALGIADWERVRLHSYYSERILARTPAFTGLASLAGAHHERLDGSGYHRAADADSLSDAMRVLAAADAYVALTSERPQRAAFEPERAAEELQAGAEHGRLCGRAVARVLTAAGHQRVQAPGLPCNLTGREAQVLALLARGLTNKQIGVELLSSPRTVQHHVAHIYDKIGCRTRAGAAMFAMEHRLLGAAAERST